MVPRARVGVGQGVAWLWLWWTPGVIGRMLGTRVGEPSPVPGRVEGGGRPVLSADL